MLRLRGTAARTIRTPGALRRAGRTGVGAHQVANAATRLALPPPQSGGGPGWGWVRSLRQPSPPRNLPHPDLPTREGRNAGKQGKERVVAATSASHHIPHATLDSGPWSRVQTAEWTPHPETAHVRHEHRSTRPARRG